MIKRVNDGFRNLSKLLRDKASMLDSYANSYDDLWKNESLYLSWLPIDIYNYILSLSTIVFSDAAKILDNIDYEFNELKVLKQDNFLKILRKDINPTTNCYVLKYKIRDHYLNNYIGKYSWLLVSFDLNFNAYIESYIKIYKNEYIIETIQFDKLGNELYEDSILKLEVYGWVKSSQHEYDLQRFGIRQTNDYKYLIIKYIMGNNNSFEVRLNIIEKKLIEKEVANLKEVEQLNREIETLKNINKDLETRLQERNHKQIVNDEHIEELEGDLDEYINKLLEDPDVNIPYLPDYVEKQIYRNVFSKLYGLLGNVLAGSSIKLAGGKQIKLSLV